MKKVVMIVLLLSGVSMLNAQVNAPYVGVFQRFEGMSYIPKEGSMVKSTEPISITGIDITIGRRIFFLAQVGYYTQMRPQNASLLRPYWYNGIFIGTGVGGYVLDLRNEGVGHALSANLSYTIRLPFSDKVDKFDAWSDIKNYSVPSYTMGGELMVSYLYGFFKHLTLKASVNFGVSVLGFGTATLYDFESNYGLGINYGFSIGLAF